MRRALLLMASVGTLGVVGLLAAATLCSGCSTLGYYRQSLGGHLDMLQRARPVDDWLADAATPPALRERLALAQRLRAFAVQELALPDNRSYTRYADLGRPAAVWNVVAAPELSLTLHTWCYPVMGCVGYRGYFDRAAADAEAATQRASGRNALVYGVPAYSTLGWSNWLGGDPLLNTFVNGSEAALARLVFHELAHQVLYVADDTTFNESFATAVERLGLARWQAAHGGAAEDPAAARRRADFRTITGRARAALAALYTSDLPDETKRARKAELLAAMRAEHAALKAGAWQGFSGYDEWFAKADNAALALQAAYDGLVPGFERLFATQQATAPGAADFTQFYDAVRQLAKLPREQRRATLGTTP